MVAVAVRKEVGPDEQAACPGLHQRIERTEMGRPAFVRGVQVKEECEDPLAGMMVLPVSGIQVIIELAVAAVVGRLPGFEVRGIDTEPFLEIALDALQHRLQLAAEPLLMGRLTDPMARQHVVVRAIALPLVGEAGTPEREGELFEYSAALVAR